LRSLETKVRGNLKCHFGGLAIVIPDLETARAGALAPKTNPKAAEYDVEVTRAESYGAKAELAYNRYGTGFANGAQEPAVITSRISVPLSTARQRIFETLKASAEIAEVSDLYPDGRYRDTALFGAFAPLLFIYRPPDRVQPPEEERRATARRFYFVYNGRFLIVGAFCDPDGRIPLLSETVSDVSLLMSKSGYEFRWLSPIATPQSLDLGGTSAASSPLDGVLNDSVGRVGTTTILRSVPRGVQDSLRSLYATSFQYLTAFYALREESDTQEALIKTIESHRETVLDLMHEFNRTSGRHFLRRRKMRTLIRDHCLGLTEKIGRVDAISDSLSQGIISLDSDLQQDPDLTFMFEREPNWKGYLRHDFDTRPVLDMVTRTYEAISRQDLGLVLFLVALVAAAAGSIVGSILAKIL